MAVSVSPGYLFRPVSESGRVLDEPLTYGAMYERLKTYLVTLGLFEGETPHSFRAGCALTLSLSSSLTSANIKNHVGWASERSAGYYTRSTVLRDSKVTAQALADSVQSSVSASEMFEMYADFTDLIHLFT